TDDKGIFKISVSEEDGEWLYASFPGYSTDSLKIIDDTSGLEFLLTEDTNLAEVIIDGTQKGIVFSRLDIGKTELITKTGLMKMACCTLAESFENSATVTVGFTDAISGTKQIQLLGLAGLYGQLMYENVPVYRGLLAPFGWNYVPGQWMESVWISKGASSVVNGYESISGQINAEMRKPNQTEPLFINLYSDVLGRYEANITSAAKVTESLSAGLLINGATETKSVAGDIYHDRNKDGFRDMPESGTLNVYNRWVYIKDKIQSRTGLRLLYDGRRAGQLEQAEHIITENDLQGLYTTEIENKNLTVENKTGVMIDENGKSIGIISSFNSSRQNLEYGRKLFKGSQQSFYANVLYTNTENPLHNYTVGASLILDDYNTWYEDMLKPTGAGIIQTPRAEINRREVVPGAFAEYTFNSHDKLILTAGIREDRNSYFGWLLTPRVNIRYNIIPELVIRTSAGKGYRSPNVITDNAGLLATSRQFNIQTVDSLNIEDAWNYGGSLSAYIPVLNDKTLTVSIDYFHTRFINQAVADFERSPYSVFFYNLQGKSSADAIQADLSISPLNGLDIFAAVRYNSTKVTYTDGNRHYTLEKPLISRYKGLFNVSYATARRAFVFDITAQANGPSRLPSTKGYSAEQEYSPPFTIYFAQVTKNAKHFDIYVGSENILDFRQSDPVRHYSQHFGQDFDASVVWGPVTGRKIYAGIRWRIGKTLH
ncbi:MAG: TonB-dependent receptor, partial [Dysgonamonadaceae bacterium]|nr:TonB-dependent receptor [Dysgonamonadaceae bacterium]